ncbi:fatty acid desaturase [uncultured Bradyrhizobium sp.]|uniref:fatty acid desaturase n=1 Tax=uncultured Bradyrhizobium sp. TaxID=199684 RepID=UPI0035CAB8C8
MSDPVDVRASLARFPAWTQHFWTWFTGKALPHQRPLIMHTWYSYLIVTLALFAGGLVLSSVAVAWRFPLWWAAMILGWVLTLNGARTMILVVAHQCIHGQFSGNHKRDVFVGELVTLLTMSQTARGFKIDHFQTHHKRATFATLDDPPVKSLIDFGFLPGLSKRELWLRAFLTFISPVFYLKGISRRLRSNLFSERKWRRHAFIVYAAFWLSLPLWLPNGLSVLLLAFGVPIVVLFQISALLDNLGEHAWLTPRDPRLSSRHYHVPATWARFCGRPLPDRSLPAMAKPVAWVTWAAAMMLYHLPARLLVVVGDLPNHDFHHRFPATPHWMCAAYARQWDIDSGHDGSPAYSEIWGLGHAIDRMFQELSNAEPYRSARAAHEPEVNAAS